MNNCYGCIIIFVNYEKVTTNFCCFNMDVAPQNKFLENILTLTQQLGKSQVKLFVKKYACVHERGRFN